MDNNSAELNYEFIILRHIDRLSQVCTSYMVNNSNEGVFVSRPVSDTALSYGVKFLQIIIPESLHDDIYINDLKCLNDDYKRRSQELMHKNNSDSEMVFLTRQFDFRLLAITINLLDRKGLLLPYKVQGVVKRKSNKTDDVVREVWDGS